MFRLFISEGFISAFLFACGVVLVEMIYVYITLLLMQKIQHNVILKRYINRVSWGFVLVFAIMSVYDALLGSQQTETGFLFPFIPRFIYGMMLSAINPIQILFWMGWNTILFSKNILVINARPSLLYITGIGIGTLLGFAVFMIPGQLFAGAITDYNVVLRWITAILFTGFLFFITFKNSKDLLSSSRYGERS
ncbi:MAG: LysE family transporter [Bacteroidetes bacterium]|nr:LysE family transporter [Bacteroidota bacterium]